MFLVEKRYGTLKARTCANGSKQVTDERYNKHDYDSPTFANNSVMIIFALEAKGFQYMAIIDILGCVSIYLLGQTWQTDNYHVV